MSYFEDLKTKVQVGKNVFIANTATVIGNVILEDEVSIWFGAVLRADFDRIKIGKKSNIQEGVIMHVDHGSPIEIGECNVVGHGAIIHGSKIGNNCLIGMRATILNGAKIGNNCIIGAHALVTENMVIPDNSMVLGTPGKVVKTLDADGVKMSVMLGVEEYLAESKRYLGI